MSWHGHRTAFLSARESELVFIAHRTSRSSDGCCGGGGGGCAMALKIRILLAAAGSNRPVIVPYTERSSRLP